MSISASIRMALAKAGMKQMDLAEVYGWSKQAMSTKLARDGWDATDLCIVASVTGGRLLFEYPDGQKIFIEADPEKIAKKGKKKTPDESVAEE